MSAVNKESYIMVREVKPDSPELSISAKMDDNGLGINYSLLNVEAEAMRPEWSANLIPITGACGNTFFGKPYVGAYTIGVKQPMKDGKFQYRNHLILLSIIPENMQSLQ